MRQLEKASMEKMEEILSSGVKNADELVDLFSSCVQKEIAVYGLH